MFASPPRFAASIALAAALVGPSLGWTQTVPGGTAEPFVIDVPQAVLDDLEARLAAARPPDPIEGVGWGYGTDPAAPAALIRHWRSRSCCSTAGPRPSCSSSASSRC